MNMMRHDKTGVQECLFAYHADRIALLFTLE
jgi:hypothetical protein